MIPYLFIALLFTALTPYLIAKPVPPLESTQTKTQIQLYHDSGQYLHEINAVVQRASRYINKQVKQNNLRVHPKKLAIVLDIDETSLSNYPVVTKADVSGDTPRIFEHILKGVDPAIKPVLHLYQQAKKDGIALFFITGRRTKVCPLTELNLQRAGYKKWAGLYCRPQNDTTRSVSPFKSQMRKTLTEQGYFIIASIGDQKSDLSGGYAEKGFKIPNPFYYLP
ncbi:MAG: HAD family acid phosphatase [Gammaproteobacteria bacterium]|nr:HAD family acid phosphatase [Gammaproteobacteria bacterium]